MLPVNLGTRLGSALNTGRAVLNPQNLQRRIRSAQVGIVAQIERRKPPIKLLPNQFKELHSLWLQGLLVNRDFVKERQVTEFPQMEQNINELLDQSDVLIESLRHTSDNPLISRLESLKKDAIALGIVHLIFWVTNPRSLDKSIFNQKAITYFLNQEHEKGHDKYKSLIRSFGIKNDSEAANKIYDFLCNRLSDVENNLYEVSYTKYGIVCTYISPFIHHSKPDVISYMVHVWMSRYYYPEKKDLQALVDKKGPNLNISGPFIEGWGRLVTLYVTDQPTKDKMVFVNSKNFQDLDQVKALEVNDQEQKGSWLINDKATLLANKDDWRKAFPALQKG